MDEKEIIKELKIDAKAVGIPVGAAEIFIKKALKDAGSLSDTKIVKELNKYNKDLAYVYANRDKII